MVLTAGPIQENDEAGHCPNDATRDQGTPARGAAKERRPNGPPAARPIQRYTPSRSMPPRRGSRAPWPCFGAPNARSGRTPLERTRTECQPSGVPQNAGSWGRRAFGRDGLRQLTATGRHHRGPGEPGAGSGRQRRECVAQPFPAGQVGRGHDLDVDAAGVVAQTLVAVVDLRTKGSAKSPESTGGRTLPGPSLTSRPEADGCVSR